MAAFVETSPTVRVGEVVRQVGGGCSAWGKGDFGVMQWSLQRVIRIPAGTSRDIVTEGRAGTDTPGAPCSGDSGGALFAVVRDKDGKIVDELGKYIGTTSRSDTRTIGYFSSYMVPEDVEWLRSLEPRGYKVCGNLRPSRAVARSSACQIPARRLRLPPRFPSSLGRKPATRCSRNPTKPCTCRRSRGC